MVQLNETMYFLLRKLRFVTVVLPIKQSALLQNKIKRAGAFERARVLSLEMVIKKERERHERAGTVCRDILEPCQFPDKKNKRGEGQPASPQAPSPPGLACKRATVN